MKHCTFHKFRSAHSRNLQVFVQLMYLEPVFFADILYCTIKQVLASYLPLPFPSFSTLSRPASVKMSELTLVFIPGAHYFNVGLFWLKLILKWLWFIVSTKPLNILAWSVISHIVTGHDCCLRQWHQCTVYNQQPMSCILR